jgi:hypothetical protein
MSYFTAPGGTGTEYFAGHMITSNMTLYVFAETATMPNCTSESSFTISIGGQPQTFAPLVRCPDTTGSTNFVFADIAQQMQNTMPSTEISFYTTAANANAMVNPLVSYSIAEPGSETIFIRVDTMQSCYSVSEFVLVAADCTNNTITGTITFDQAADGCDSSDSLMPNVQVTLTNGNEITHAYTNASGTYEFTNVQEGNNILNAQGLPNGYVVSPSPSVVAISGDDINATADFCVTGPLPVNDASVIVVSTGPPIPGFAMHYIMQVSNVGNMPLSGSATFTYNNAMLAFNYTSPASSSQTANSVTFNFSNLGANGLVTYHLYFTVFTPPTVVAGNILIASGNVTTIQTDANAANNTMMIQHTVVNSYDPNDISVHEGPFITEEQADGFLHYTIRFQNSGTAPAVNVRLENALDSDLDWSTFMPLAASHPYYAERNGGDLTFSFNDIMLPAEQDDEPGSHGWITYKVKPVSGFAIGDVISNTADIFFDFNEAIVTNTVITEIQQLALDGNDIVEVKLYPNPASSNVYFSGLTGAFHVQVYDVQGKIIKSESLYSNQPLDISNIEAGIYFVKVSADGKVVTRKLIVE